MATLAAQIETDIQVVVPSATLIKLTNQESPNASSIGSTLLTKACTHAAADLTGIVGSKTSDDVDAVSLGVDMALFKLRYSYRGLNPPEGSVTWNDLLARAREMRDRDRQEENDTMRWHAPDGTAGDKRRPAAKRDRGYTQSTDAKG